MRLLLEAVFQRDAAVEHHVVSGAVPVVQAEITQTHELERGRIRAGAVLLLIKLGGHLLHLRLDLASGEDRQTVRVQAFQEVLVRAVGLLVGEQVVVQPHLGVQAVGGVHPVERRALDLAAVGGVAAPGIRVVSAEHLGDVAVLVLDAAGAGDQIRTLETALQPAGGQSLVLGDGDFHKVVCLDPQVAGESDVVGALGGIGGVVLHGDSLALPLGIVDNGELHRPENGHSPLGMGVQILPQAMLQKAVLNDIGGLGHADALAEITDGRGGVAPAAQAAQCGHTGIVPSGDIVLLHQLAQLALGHDGVVDAQAGELDLPGTGGQLAVVDDPVIQGAVCLKLQRAQAVGDALQRVLDGVGKVVHGIDAPLIALPVVAHVVDAVDHRVAHIEVAAGQVDLGPKGHRAVGELPCAHPGEEVQALLHRPVTVGGHGRDADVSAVGLELLRRQLADIGQALFDEQDGLAVVLLKVIRAVEEPIAPVEAQPVDVLLDGLYELLVLLGGVGVVHPQVAQAVVFLRRAEVDGQGLAVADVQIAVRLRRKTGVDGHSLELTTLCDVLVDEIQDKVFAGFLRYGGLDVLGHCLTLLVVVIKAIYNYTRFWTGLQ